MSACRSHGFGPRLAATTHDAVTTFSYTPASQLASVSRDNDLYAWSGHYNVDRAYSVNGLNQLTTAGSVALGYDGRGNLTSSGSTSYAYTADNMLKSASGGVSAQYDPAGRLVELNQSASTRFLYQDAQMAAEVANPSGAVQRRYVWGDGPGDRGSVVAYTNASGVGRTEFWGQFI
ncbi:hypothetical protein [Sandarakinorhabdus sp.]|uniref:hypothetical protein n=1 Tax=Sandarakinorhabdus sp. TaxID=1916663 RepID=UPI00286DF8A2|nr:hypothetical protein [Sandarakinorhabdus sp.]